MPSLGVELRGIVRRYPATRRTPAVAAVDGVTLNVVPGAFVSLLGPSGCGKTTLLRIVGGLEAPDAGTVAIGGVDQAGRPPQHRPTAMVFQSYALFPTMTVGENVAYGLTVRGVRRAEARAAAARALARVDLSGALDRPVTALSGGQQQRVALARALAVEPAVLLFDEPLSNLDLALREATRAEIRALQHELGTTSLYVTHDQGEALALSDRVALMRAGRLIAYDTPEALYASPPTAWAARFLGGANVVRDAAVAARLAGEPGPAGAAFVVRPEALVAVAPDAPRAVAGRVVARQFLGTHAEWRVDVAGVRLRLSVAPDLAVPDAVGVVSSGGQWVPDDLGDDA